ncbi:pyrroloquinoline quinone precursor peptide PqqA [Streptomyces kanamyceticus]|uniref:pyrroloquinoline quinone precursor peptide PqqA n=1 Tax=Streptomyces kanamyceticus TaxID=1967 RepID=UPI0037DCF6A3
MRPEQSRPTLPHRAAPAPRATDRPAPAHTDWQSPDYAVVDTALEVTAYRLADR